VNGDEVRRLIFPRGGGYDTNAVDELLDRVATELDAGRPVAPLIEWATFPEEKPRGRHNRGGYEFAAVDGALSQLCRQDDPASGADPWRDLPAWGYSMASWGGGGADLAALARPRAARDWAATDYKRACAAAWSDFSLQPGTQLSLVKTSFARSELRTAEQYALVSVQEGFLADTFSADGRTFRLSTVKAARWLFVAAEIGTEPPGSSPAHLPRAQPVPPAGKKASPSQGQGARKPGSLRALADRTGQPVLYTRGHHIDGDPSGYIEFPGQRWLRFPVRGTGSSNAVMTAVDQSGRQVARYRTTAERIVTGWRAIEITVHPDQRLTDQLILTLAVTAPWVSSFFSTSH
jgi:DivIVA domain-containing protein